jgi:hypothetical protein
MDWNRLSILTLRSFWGIRLNFGSVAICLNLASLSIFKLSLSQIRRKYQQIGKIKYKNKPTSSSHAKNVPSKKLLKTNQGDFHMKPPLKERKKAPRSLGSAENVRSRLVARRVKFADQISRISG